MDDEVNQAHKLACREISIKNQRNRLRDRTNSFLTLGYNGGMFNATQEQILFIKLLVDTKKIKQPVLDRNMNPIMIEDLVDFYETLLGRHTEIINEYYVDYEALKKWHNSNV